MDSTDYVSLPVSHTDRLLEMGTWINTVDVMEKTLILVTDNSTLSFLTTIKGLLMSTEIPARKMFVLLDKLSDGTKAGLESFLRISIRAKVGILPGKLTDKLSNEQKKTVTELMK